MSRQIQIRRGTAAEHTDFVGAIGEVTMDTTNNTLRVHDGVTPGGTILAKQSDVAPLSNIALGAQSVCPVLAMPGTKYEEISVKDSGMYYMAPADGYVIFARTANGDGQYNALTVLAPDSDEVLYRSEICPSASGMIGAVTVPVRYGNRVQIEYTTTGMTKYARFVYAANVAE